MQLKDALTLSNQLSSRVDGTPYNIHLACGFTPLHLGTFLLAHAAQRNSVRRFTLSVGHYGDVLESFDEDAAKSDAVVLLIEFSDLDPRLGIRRQGSWTGSSIEDALKMGRAKLGQITDKIKSLRFNRLVVVLPTLPIPPFASTGSWQMSKLELSLSSMVADFAEEIGYMKNVAVCSKTELDSASAPNSRRNPAMELISDFPYTSPHAAAIAQIVIENLLPPTPLKGIITDLDDTFWRGLIGEVGHENVHWSLDGKSQSHALYQQLLGALSERGILIAVASKNELSIASRGLKRSDVLIPESGIFPQEVNWQPKSDSISRILKVWNISADAVIFVDDNEMELSQVQSIHPTIRTLHFKTKDDTAIYRTLIEIRDLFHKEYLTEEDNIRLSSIRAGADINDGLADATSLDDFLSGLGQSLKLEFTKSVDDKRSFELVNKTNQFNLNGMRLDEAQWTKLCEEDSNFIMSASYKDKFGPLGKIAVMFGNLENSQLHIQGWVLSCRAFSRRIEHAMLRAAVEKFSVKEVVMAYKKTEKNGPALEFLESLNASDTMTRVEEIMESFPKIYATVV